jgi:Lon protease-like protein
MDEIGLFPLGMVLLPGEQVPLHIFEPRYRDLIGECVDEDREFGLVLGDDDGIHEIGTAAAVVAVIERFQDGRLNIVVEGRERIRILEETSGRTFRTARVETMPDAEDTPSEEEVERCLAAYRSVVEAAEAEEAGEPAPGDEGLAYWMAARIDFGPEAKQELLELTSERERVVKLEELLARARAALTWAKTARERASGNGRVEPPG